MPHIQNQYVQNVNPPQTYITPLRNIDVNRFSKFRNHQAHIPCTKFGKYKRLIAFGDMLRGADIPITSHIVAYNMFMIGFNLYSNVP